MKLDEIAASITSTGYAAAIIGVILCLVVLAIRFRARNLALEALNKASKPDEAEPESQVSEPVAPEPEQASAQPKSAFKAYVPSEENAGE